MRIAPLLALVFVPSIAAQSPQHELLADVEARLVAVRAELAQRALDVGLLREAGALVGEVLAVDADHQVAALTAKLKEFSGARFALTYKKALEKSGRSFRRSARKLLAPFAKELVKLGAEAAKEGRAELAETIYLRAFDVDPDNRQAAQALRKLDYDVVFNYGVIPRAEKQAARKMLRALGGTFLGRKGLEDELEFWNDAWGLKTQHYRFVTNAGHRTVFQFARACEDLYAAWEQFMKGSGLKVRKLSKPCSIYLFDSEVSYETILRVRGQDPSDSNSALGFYSAFHKVGFFYDDPDFYEGDLTLLLETFFHEGAHQLFDLRLQAPWKGDMATEPLNWVEEGFATYLESLEVKEDGNRRGYSFGQLIDDDLGGALARIDDGRLWDTKDFVHLNLAGFDAYRHAYPHATLLVHWLFEADGGKRRKAAFELLYAERTMGGLRRQTMFELLKTTPEELDQKLREHAADIGERLRRRKYE